VRTGPERIPASHSAQLVTGAVAALAHSVCLVYLVYLVYSVYSVCLVYLVYFVCFVYWAYLVSTRIGRPQPSFGREGSPRSKSFGKSSAEER